MWVDDLANIYTYVIAKWLSGKESTCQCRRCRRHGFYPWVGKIPWRSLSVFSGTLCNLGRSACPLLPCCLPPTTLTWPPFAHSCFQTLTLSGWLILKVSNLTSFSTYTKGHSFLSLPPLPQSYPLVYFLQGMHHF